MNKFIFLLVAIGLLLPLSSTQAGVVIGGTRFIYDAEKASLSIPVRNTSSSSWLIDSHVQPASRWPGAETMPASAFVVTPPLFTLAAGQENRLRLVYCGAGLPDDKESVFTLSIAAIPSGNVTANSVQMAFRSAMKLIYRPANLRGDPQQAYRQLHWSWGHDGLAVHNPTPYYVTLFQLRINGQSRDSAGVVAPFATRPIRGCMRTTVCHLRWQSINDYGRVMPPLTADATRQR